MSKLFLTGRIPADYNRQVWFDILRQIETVVNPMVDGYLFPVTSVTANYSATINDALIVVDASSAAVTITLKPAAEAKQKRLTIKKVDATGNLVTITGSENIDGASTQNIGVQYDSVCVMSDGTQWWLV